MRTVAPKVETVEQPIEFLDGQDNRFVAGLRRHFEALAMDLHVEREVWRLLQEHFPAEMDDLLEGALGSYRRSPGYSALTRIHPEQVGAEGLKCLIGAVSKHPHSQAEIRSPGYVELRAPLRAHLCRYLQRFLIDHSRATEPVMEAYLALEVGL